MIESRTQKTVGKAKKKKLPFNMICIYAELRLRVKASLGFGASMMPITTLAYATASLDFRPAPIPGRCASCSWSTWPGTCLASELQLTQDLAKLLDMRDHSLRDLPISTCFLANGKMLEDHTALGQWQPAVAFLYVRSPPYLRNTGKPGGRTRLSSLGSLRVQTSRERSNDSVKDAKSTLPQP